MQRLRELMAHGGIATLAVVFALAFALFEIANATAEAAVTALRQHAIDDGEGDLSFTVADTTIFYAVVLRAAIAFLLVGVALYVAWRLARATLTTCPECRSEVPRQASICRYCTSELPESPS